MNYDRWKNHPIAPWVERLLTPKEACVMGMRKASRFRTPEQAWALTNDPEELAWVIHNFDPERRRRAHLASLTYGWRMALKKITPASNRRLARLIRKEFTRPASFCS